MEIDLGLVLERSEEQLVDCLLESSADLPLDILETDPHPENLTLAMFSQMVYTEKEWNETDEYYGEKLDLPQGWCLLATGSNSGTTNGYFGAAFFNRKLQRIVVAHRGTLLSNIGALFTDVLGICGSKYKSCANSALTFTEHIRKIIISVNTQHNRCYNLVITGHSLGGWLGQITAFTVKWLNESGGKLMKNTSGGIHAKTVVFDSPGAKEMLYKIQDDYFPRYSTPSLDGLNITEYVLVPNVVNTTGFHLGSIYQVKIDESNLIKKQKNSLLYNLKSHAVDNFVVAFRNKSDIYKVKDWQNYIAEFNSRFRINALNNHNDFVEQMDKLHLHNTYEAGPSGHHEGMILEFINAVRDDNVKVVEKILTEQDDNKLLLLEHKVHEEMTALQFAVQCGYLDMVHLLADQTSGPLFNDKITLFHTAAEFGHLDIVKFFKERGADINIRSEQGYTALMLAAANGHLPTVEFLVKNISNINSKDNDGNTALHNAVWGDNLSVIIHLVENGAEINSTNNDSVTVLQYAVRHDFFPVIEYLVEKGADINSKDAYGNTALHDAVRKENLSVIKYLVKMNADINSTTNDGDTALHIAAWYGDRPILIHLLQHGAHPDSLNNRSWTSLTVASKFRKWDVMQALIDEGADVNADGGKALRWAIEREEWSIVKTLVYKKAFLHESVIQINLFEF